MKLFEVSSVLEAFWVWRSRGCGRTLRKAFGGEVSAEKQEGRAENGNAPSEFIARRKFSLHSPPNVFSSLSSRSHKQKSPPHGERQLADGGDFFETTDGVSRAARRASEAPAPGPGRRAGDVGDVNQEVGGSRPLGDPAFPGLNPARALDVNGKAAVSSPTRGGESYKVSSGSTEGRASDLKAGPGRKPHNLASIASRESPSTGCEPFESIRSSGIGFELRRQSSYLPPSKRLPEFQPAVRGVLTNDDNGAPVEERPRPNWKIDGRGQYTGRDVLGVLRGLQGHGKAAVHGVGINGVIELKGKALSGGDGRNRAQLRRRLLDERAGRGHGDDDVCHGTAALSVVIHLKKDAPGVSWSEKLSSVKMWGESRHFLSGWLENGERSSL